MLINAQTARVAATVAGLTLNVPQPFAEGYQLSATEASAMNQLLTENLRNNLAAKIKKAKDENKPWDDAKAQAEMDAYSETYQFGVRIGGARSADPVQREMESIAEGRIKDALKKKGIKLNSVDSDKMNKLILDYLTKDATAGDAIRKMAERRVKEESKLAIETLDLA